MNHQLSPREGGRETLHRGLGALGKSLLLVFGVPIATLRLAEFSATQSYTSALALLIDVVLGLVGVFWLGAVIQLTREIVRAWRAPEVSSRPSWSSSWAAGIVGLLLLAGALGAHGHPVARATPVVQVLQDRPPPRTGGEGQFAPSSSARAVAVGLGALVGAGLLWRTRQLGRLRMSLRQTGGVTGRPSGELQSLVRELTLESDGQLIDWVEATNRTLGRLFIRDGAEPIPEFALWRVGAEGIELLLRSPIAAAPAPFVASEGGWWWRLEPAVTLEGLRARGKGAPRFWPGLIPVGCDGTAEILLSVRRGELLGVLGAEELVDAVLDALLVAIRILPWCDELAVELIGFDAPPLEQQSVHVQTSSVEMLESIGGRPAAPRTALREGWRREPVALVGRRALARDHRGRIVSAARAVGGVIASEEAEMTLTVGEGSAQLMPFGITLNVHKLLENERALVDRLLADYAQPQQVISLGRDDEAARHGTPTDIEIAILGPNVEIIGAHLRPHPEDVARVHELLIYLCLHDFRSTTSELAEAMFLRLDPHHATRRLENLLAISRAMLGQTQRGTDRLKSGTPGVIELDRSVTLDWFRIRDNIERARDVDARAAIALLREALGTIDPEHLLAEVVEYPWFQAMRYCEVVSAALIDAAHHLVTLARDIEESALIEETLLLAHSLEPGSEIVARDLMMFADMTGDRDAIERVYRDLESTLEALGGTEPSAITLRLFLALTGGENDK